MVNCIRYCHIVSKYILLAGKSLDSVCISKIALHLKTQPKNTDVKNPLFRIRTRINLKQEF
jgi:hypothetical protein